MCQGSFVFGRDLCKLRAFWGLLEGTINACIFKALATITKP